MSFREPQWPGIGLTGQFTTAEFNTLVAIAMGGSGGFQYKIFVTVGTANADYLVGNYTDIGAAINAAYAALPSSGGAIFILGGTYTYSTPIVFGTNLKQISLLGGNAVSTVLQFTPTSGNAITINDGNPTGHLSREITGFTLMGSATLIAAGNTNTNTSIGIYYGGSNGAVGVNTHDMNVNGFGTNWEIGANAYMLAFNNNTNSGGNGGQASQGSLVHINTAANSGERNVFNGNSFTDPGNSSPLNGIYITNGGTADNFFNNNSIDDVQVFIGSSNGQTTFIGNHIENPAYGTYGVYIPILGVSSNNSTQITFIGNLIANDAPGTSGFSTIINHGGQLYAASNNIQNYGGGTIANFADHGLDNGGATDYIVQTQVQSGTLTNLVAGGGGVAYSTATGNTAVYNVDNSYTIGLQANGNNTNNFFSGGSSTGTFDHNGNWTFGISAVPSTVTINKNLVVKGGHTAAYVAKTSTYGMGTSDYMVDCTSNSFTVTLPTAVGVAGQIYIIKNSGTGTITLATTSSQTIDGAASGTLTLSTQYSAMTLMSDGSNWKVIA